MPYAVLALLSVALLAVVRPASADIPPTPPATEVTLTVVASCPDTGQTTTIPIRPPCTFEGWSAQVRGQTLVAKRATGARRLPSCDVDDQGECAFAVTATGRISGEQFDVQSYSLAPVGNVTAVGRLLVPLDVMCTEEECPQDDPCCHGCGHSGWQIVSRRPEIRAYPAAGVPEFPSCELNGCGSCETRLTAWGVEVGGIFIVSSHGETRSQALSASGKCTLMACMSANPCCNTCGFMGWSAGALKAVPGEGVEPLPPCELDGCGRCAWMLLADGEEKDGTFVIEEWKQFP